MKEFKKTGINIRKKQVVTVLVVTMLIVTAFFFTPISYGANQESPQETPLKPSWDSSGNVTWDCVYFGHYPQGKNSSGDYRNDPIKWRVLSINESKALLLSDKSLDREQYYPETVKMDWEKSTLRKWLNGYTNRYSDDNFINKAFTDEEQAAISTETIINEDNPMDGSCGGNNTKDKIFLLSMSEAMNPEYGFPNDYEYSKTRISQCTAYGANHCGREDGYSDWWWLRTPARKGMTTGLSSIQCDGINTSNFLAVRPAIYLDLNSELWENAEKVSSEGWRNNTQETVQQEQTIECQDTYIKTEDVKSFPILTQSKTICSYESDNLQVAKMSETEAGRVIICGSGEANITINAKETMDYKGAVKTVKLIVRESGENVSLKNPVISSDGTVTWDCVYFGHYLQSQDGVGGFNRDKIKWRVLSVDGDEVLLLSDKIIDKKKFNEIFGRTRWENSTIRSWLNGYGEDENYENIDYSSDNFMRQAFTEEEQKAIKIKTLKNPGDTYYQVDAGKDTSDGIFLPTLEDVCNSAYGFVKDYNLSITREAKATDYLKEKNALITVDPAFADNWTWRLRSPGHSDNGYYAASVNIGGNVDHDGFDRDSGVFIAGIRPAVYMDALAGEWQYAGTVSSNNTRNDDIAETPPQSQTIICPKSFDKTYGCDPFELGASAKTTLSYESSDSKVASVSTAGKVSLKNPGKAIITITAVETGSYTEASAKVSIISRMGTPSISVKAYKGKKIKLSWSKVAGASGYNIKIYKGGSTKCIWNLKKNSNVKSITHKGLKAKKVYKYKVCSYRDVNGKNVYSSYSKIKSAKARR